MKLAGWRVVVAAAFLFGGSGVAFAAGSPRDPTRAEQLFLQGKDALARGDFGVACAAFDASQKADPSVGALLNLARCHERQGRTATAWTEYRDAAMLAGQRGDDERKRGALELADKLDPRLSRIVVEVSPQHGDVEVRVDGQPMAAMSRGLAMPVDPGEHVVEASADGYHAWRASVPVVREASRITVIVPQLRALPPSKRAQFVTGVVAGSIGVATLVAGVVQSVRALRMDRDLEGQCGPVDDAGARYCGAGLQADIDRLELTSNSATVLLAAGGTVGITGALLMMTASGGGKDGAGPPRSAISIVPTVGANGFGVRFGGAF